MNKWSLSLNLGSRRITAFGTAPPPHPRSPCIYTVSIHVPIYGSAGRFSGLYGVSSHAHRDRTGGSRHIAHSSGKIMPFVRKTFLFVRKRPMSDNAEKQSYQLLRLLLFARQSPICGVTAELDKDEPRMPAEIKSRSARIERALRTGQVCERGCSPGVCEPCLAPTALEILLRRGCSASCGVAAKE